MERTIEKMKDPLYRFLEREVNVAENLLRIILKNLKDVNLMCMG